MPIVTGIYRYPIKGLSAQPVIDIELEAGKPFPFDRVFALARPGAAVDPAEPKWGKKGLFVMLMLDEGLAEVQTTLDIDTLHLKITQAGAHLLSADLHTTQGRAAVEAFFTTMLPKFTAPIKLVQATNGHFMDKPDNVVSLINLATLRSLEQKWGYAIDPLRFRANFYIDDAAPWSEFDWIGSDLQLGTAVLHADRRNGRCNATNVNPSNGERDLEIPRALYRDFSHRELGVYLTVKQTGAVALGDRVTLQAGTQTPPPDNVIPITIGLPGPRRFICRGCYFIYDEASGLPASSLAPGTRFADIPAQWRCADCGAEKTAFLPYVAKLAK